MVPVQSYPAPYSGSITAEDANNDINPAEIEAAVENYRSSSETAFKNVSNKIQGVEPEACEAIIVQRTNIGGKMEEVASKIDAISSQVASQFDHLPSLAMAKHDEIQTIYNAEAEAKAQAEWDRFNSQVNQTER